MKVSDLKVGDCYVTPTGQVRRILKIKTSVTYEARGKRPVIGRWPNRAVVDGEKFADKVVKKVPVTHEPD